MTRYSKTLLAAVALAGLAGCVESTGGSRPDAAASQTLETMRTAPEADELACLRAVAGPSGADNRIVEVISSETSEANNLVMVAVGDRRAPWRCLVKHGQVAEVMFAGNEGTL